MSMQSVMWLVFASLVAVMLVIDLGVFNRKHREISFKEASIWSLVWISLALIFNAGIYFALGHAPALEFLTGYIIEKSLSVDNLFVFIMIFSYFSISRRFQATILKWGILGALVMRAIFIMMGIELLERFNWMIYIFGAILIYTGIKMAFGGDEEIHPEKNLLVRWVRKLLPVTKRIRGNRFFIRRQGILAATPLLITLVVIESSDLLFAVDSIPAILAVTRDPFIVYTSNVFAIMGLRALYFLLASVMGMFVYLKLGVSFILAFVGLKMLLASSHPLPITFSLGVISGVLTISIIASLTIGNKRRK